MYHNLAPNYIIVVPHKSVFPNHQVPGHFGGRKGTVVMIKPLPPKMSEGGVAGQI
jgi:hypothetical protein